jgi:malonate decarboxylase alpha subunit
MLQMDGDANSSTVTTGMLAGFGGAPREGSGARGRRHTTPAWLDMRACNDQVTCGRELVVQTL